MGMTVTRPWTSQGQAGLPGVRALSAGYTDADAVPTGPRVCRPGGPGRARPTYGPSAVPLPAASRGAFLEGRAGLGFRWGGSASHLTGASCGSAGWHGSSGCPSPAWNPQVRPGYSFYSGGCRWARGLSQNRFRAWWRLEAAFSCPAAAGPPTVVGKSHSRPCFVTPGESGF